MVFVFIQLLDELSSQCQIFQFRISNLQTTLRSGSFDNIPTYQMHLILVTFAPLPKKVLKKFGDLSRDGLGGKKQRELEDGEG